MAPGKTSYLPQVPQQLKVLIWFSLLTVLHGCKVFKQFLNNATFKPKKPKFWRQGSPPGKPGVLGAEINSEAKTLFRSLKIS